MKDRAGGDDQVTTEESKVLSCTITINEFYIENLLSTYPSHPQPLVEGSTWGG